jgi:hypothetical protein
VKRELGLFKNGNRWWVRVYGGDRVGVKRSTGTSDLARANQIARSVRKIGRTKRLAEWLDRAAAGEISLAELDRVYRNGELYRLRATENKPVVVDLAPLVDNWLAAVLAERRDSHLAKIYRQQLRILIPANGVFPATKFTDVHVRRTLETVAKGVGSTTQRAYFNIWYRFYKWARTKATIPKNPFEDLRPPKRAQARYF